MSTLVTRAGKGSPLTHNEVDANFNNLNTDKIQSGNTVAALTITALTTPSVQASGSGGLALKNSAGTTQISMGAGGGDNMAINVSTNLNGTNAQIDISPTGTGHVHIKPTGAGSIEIAPTNAGTINNMSIGATTASTGAFSTLSATGVTTVQAGSVSAPAITTTGDTNTGIFFPAADTIAFSEGGTESMRIDSSGNVGIGTSSMSNKLEVSNGSADVGILVKATGANYATYRMQNTSRDYSMQIRTDQSNAWTLRDETAGANRMVVDTSGNLIVTGTSTSSDESTYQSGGVFVSRRASSAGTTHANFLNGGSTVGSITSNTVATFFNTTSDYRLKENAIPITTGLQTITALNPVNFDWISKNVSDTGFLAHEFQSVIPNSVMGTKDAVDENGSPIYQQIDKSGAIPFLVAAIKELNADLAATKLMITQISNIVDAQAVRIAALESAGLTTDEVKV